MFVHRRSALVVLVIVACSESTGPDKTPASVTVSPGNSATIASGATLMLTAAVANKGGDALPDQVVAWQTTDPGIVTVSTTGAVLAHGVGTASVTASVSTLTSNAVAVTVIPGPASRLSIKVQPGSVVSGSVLTPPLVVEVTDVHGNVTASAVSVTATLIQNGGGSLGGTTSVTAVNGVATFSDLSMRSAPAPRLIAFDAPGLAGVVSSPISVQLDPVAALITLTPDTGQTVVSGATRQLFATVRNLDSAIVGGTVTWGIRDPAVATVSSSGLVSALNVGATKVVAKTASISSDSLSITVDARVEYGTAAAKIVRLAPGEQFSPAATASDASGPVAGVSFVFQSRAGGVATVDATGKITATGAGSVFVVAGTTTSVADSVYVQVTPNTGPVLRTDVTRMNYAIGDTITVRVVLDTRGATIGAATFSVTWPHDQFIGFLDFIDAADGAAGLGTLTETAVNGQLRGSVVSANGVAGMPELLLLRFKVRSASQGKSGWIFLLPQDIVGVDFVSLTSSVTPLRYPLVVSP